MPAGNFKLTVHKKPDKVVTPRTEIISIRKENNSGDYIFDYSNLDAANLTTNQILYIEGIANDPTNTYIVVASSYSQNIGTSSGSFELRIVSNGVGTQLDKNIAVTIGTNTFNISIDFRSRPETVLMEKTTPNWTLPIVVTKQDILNHCSDFDGDAIVKWGLMCGTDPNFVYNGAPYVANTMIPLDTIDTLGFSYVPINQPLGYVVEYPHLVEDSTGLITKV
jgi:hypothetical protein